METKMKIGIVVVLFIIFNSCVKESPMWERTYQIKNNTGYDITIRAFENFDGTGSFEDITLLDNQIYIGDETGGSNFSALNNPNSTRPSSSLNGSRLIVVFDNVRSLTHSFSTDDNMNAIFSEPTNRNLLRGGNYSNIGNDIYEFVLTEEDYNNATPCDGNCLD